MPFGDFIGNAATVANLRESIRAGRFPHSMILAGPRGAGKYTLVPVRRLAAAIGRKLLPFVVK
jgi:DNA polymerase III gamma/tau subunit